jgi:hypothetical protein
MAPKHVPIAQVEHGEMHHDKADEDDLFDRSIQNLDIDSVRSSDSNLSEDELTNSSRFDDASQAGSNKSSKVLNPVVESRLRKLVVTLFAVLAVFVPVLVYIASRNAEYSAHQRLG